MELMPLKAQSDAVLANLGVRKMLVEDVGTRQETERDQSRTCSPLCWKCRFVIVFWCMVFAMCKELYQRPHGGEEKKEPLELLVWSSGFRCCHLVQLRIFQPVLQLLGTWADGLSYYLNLLRAIRLHELEQNKFYEGKILKRVPAGAGFQSQTFWKGTLDALRCVDYGSIRKSRSRQATHSKRPKMILTDRLFRTCQKVDKNTGLWLILR